MRGTWQTTGPGRGTWQTTGGGGAAVVAAVMVVAAVAAGGAALAMAGAVAVAFLAAEAVAGAAIVLAWRLRARAIAHPVPRLVLSARSQVGKSEPARELAEQSLRAVEGRQVLALPAASYVRVDHQDQATGSANRTQQNKPLSMRNGPV